MAEADNMQQEKPKSTRQVKDTELYDRLGITPDATPDDIRKAYKKMAIKYHPDKNPNNETAADMFKKISEAAEVLSNEEKRQMYDRYGMEALKEGGGFGGHSAADIFEQMFGGPFSSFFGGMRRGPQKTDDIVHELQCSLEDLYKGKTSKMAVNKHIICAKCEGSGTRPGAPPAQCATCRGRGVRVIVKQIGPGMIQQMQTVCNDCGGKGETINEEDKCKNCKGKKVIKEKKVLQVYVDKGMKHGSKIVFSGESDEAPGMEPGDIIFVVTEKKHDVFRRSGNDLFVDQSIPLVEALCGFTMTIPHLDERTLVLKIKQGDIVTPGEVRMVANEGMPVHKRPYEKGSLYIQFTITFPKPESLSTKQYQTLEQTLPGRRAAPKIPAEADEVTLTKVNIEEQQRKRNRAAEEEDDEEQEHGGQRVQCAQQ